MQQRKKEIQEKKKKTKQLAVDPSLVFNIIGEDANL